MFRRSNLAPFSLLVAATLHAQCDPQWIATGSVPGSDAPIVDSAIWDPDGAGPAAPLLVVVGGMRMIANTQVQGVAVYDAASNRWSALGSAPGLQVTQVEVMASGDLVIAEPDGVHRWDGAAWQPLGATASQLLALADGRLLAARGVPGGTRFDVWDGSAWTTYAPDIDGAALAMVAMPNGDIIVGGIFDFAGPTYARSIARWNGSSWAALGFGVSGSSDVRALAALPNGDLIAGGYFTFNGGLPTNRIARWDGTAWHTLGSGVSGPIAFAAPHVAALHTLANGDLIAGGYFNSAGGVTANCVARWSNGAWAAVGIGVDRTVLTIAELPGGELFVGGQMQAISTGAARHLARWDGSTWSSFGDGPVCNGGVTASSAAQNGDLLVGGAFTSIGGVAAAHIARRSGNQWFALGGGVGGPVEAIVELPNGDIVVGGTFTLAGGTTANNVARWDGSTWSPLGSGTDGTVRALLVLTNGDVLAGGSFLSAGGQSANYVARWNGTTWSPLGAGTTLPVTAMALLAAGDAAIAASELSPVWPASHLHRWDGASLTLIADAWFGNILALHPLVDGSLLAGGSGALFTGAGLASWHAGSWSNLQLGVGSQVQALEVLPDGDIVAAGYLVVGGQPYRMARRQGTTWTPIDAYDFRRIDTLEFLPSGELIVGGEFLSIGDIVSPNLASLTATCPASATPFGVGCAGSGGLDELTATALPWLGGALRTRATGYGPLTLVAVISGFTQAAVPLPVLFAEGLPGCSAHNTGESIELALPNGGPVDTRIAVPNAPALVGASFHQYALAFEFDAAGAVVAITSSNGLTLTIGSY